MRQILIWDNELIAKIHKLICANSSQGHFNWNSDIHIWNYIDKSFERNKISWQPCFFNYKLQILNSRSKLLPSKEIEMFEANPIHKYKKLTRKATWLKSHKRTYKYIKANCHLNPHYITIRVIFTIYVVFGKYRGNIYLTLWNVVHL